ncbi:hypothetical protein C0993_000164 [Termitomyces sp. T159_Od127]|nr:hypothetical protein C0993_000164 [Termitomyces sp. T159_Od127]
MTILPAPITSLDLDEAVRDQFTFHSPGLIRCSVLGTVAQGALHGAFEFREDTQGVLDAAGFTDAGPAANSIAFHYQSSVGNITRGSPFAIAQRVAMGGHPIEILALGAVFWAIAGAIQYFFSEDQDINNSEE